MYIKIQQKKTKGLKRTFKNYANLMQSSSKSVKQYDLPTPKKTVVTQNAFKFKNKKYNISIPATAMGSIQLSKNTPKAFKSSASFSSLPNNTLNISLPNKDMNTFTGKAMKASDNTIVYTEYEEDTDVAIQVFKDAVKIHTVINSAASPTKYRYQINLPQGAKMKKLKDGGVFILDKNKKLIGFFAPPWAIDKNGKEIPTHYKINGATLTQVVNHLNINDVAYPVVADPYYGYTMVDAGQWLYDGQHSSNSWFNYRLFIFPTKASRWFHSESAGAAGWQEIRSFMAYTQGSSNNEVSLRNQYICHVQNAWIRPGSYHLEQWRRPVSYPSTVWYGCNPPGVM